MIKDDDLTLFRWGAMPTIAAAMAFLCFDSVHRLSVYALDHQFQALSAPLYYVGQVGVPVLVALVVCYPLAAIYGRWAALGAFGSAASGAVLLQWILSGFEWAAPALPLSFAVLCAVTPLLADQARRAMVGGAQLAWLDENDKAAAVAREPTVLGWVMLPLLACAFFSLHDVLQPMVMDVAFSPTSPSLERSGLLLGSVVGPALAALPVTYVAARLYGRNARWMGLAASLPAALYWAVAYLGKPHLPLVTIAFALEVLGLLLWIPFMVWRTQRLLSGARLMFVPASQPA